MFHLLSIVLLAIKNGGLSNIFTDKIVFTEGILKKLS